MNIYTLGGAKGQVWGEGFTKHEHKRQAWKRKQQPWKRRRRAWNRIASSIEIAKSKHGHWRNQAWTQQKPA